MHEVLVNRLGGLSLPRKSVARLTDRPDMTLDVYRGRKTTIQQKYNFPQINVSGKQNQSQKRCETKDISNAQTDLSLRHSHVL